MAEEITTMWLETIRYELDALDEKEIVPLDNCPVAANEKVIGYVEHDLHKRLFTLSRLYTYRAAQLDVERKYGSDLSTKNDGELSKMHARAQIVGLLFWTEIRDTLPNYGSDAIGLREDWQLVEGPVEGPKKRLLGLLGLDDE